LNAILEIEIKEVSLEEQIRKLCLEFEGISCYNIISDSEIGCLDAKACASSDCKSDPSW